MKKYNFGLDESRAFRLSQRVKVTDADLTNTTNAAAQSIILTRVKAGTIVRGFFMRLTVPFEDATDGTFNDTQVKVGDAVDDDRLLTTTQINKNGTEILIKAFPTTVPAVYDADTDIVAAFASMTGKNLAALTKGEVNFFFDAVNIDEVL